MYQHAKVWLAVFCGVWLLLAAGVARALPVTYTETAVGGNWGYDFTLTNEFSSGIWEMKLELPIPDTSLLSFGSPSGWGDGFGVSMPYYGSPGSSLASFIDWWTDSVNELVPGGVLSGFSFVSDKKIMDPMLYSASNYDGIYDGTLMPTPAPGPVPEPASLFLLASGLAGLICCRRFVTRES